MRPTLTSPAMTLQMEGHVMNKLIATAGLAAALASPPASAATFLTVTNTSPSVCTGVDPTCNFVIAGQVDTVGEFRVTSAIFNLPTNGVFAGTATNTATNTTNIDFTGVTLTNDSTGEFFTGAVQNGFFDLAFFGPAGVAPGIFTLTLVGNATVDNGTPPSFPSIGGTASFTAAVVPEPATWALFILGFGAIGSALRRRSGAVRVSKAKLNFA